MPRLSIALTFSCLAALISRPASAQPTPACSLEGPDHCQLYDGSLDRTPSDRTISYDGLSAADDFVPLGDTLSALCVWGQYINTDFQAATADCSAEAAPDAFRVKIFTNGQDVPDVFVGESTATSTRTPMSLDRGTTGPATVYRFELTLDTPITGLINDGRAYWLDVSNSSSTPSAPHCYWHWSRLSPESAAGNDYSAQGEDYGYWPTMARSGDYAFCLNVDIAPGGLGPTERPCCRCDGSCDMRTLAQCDQVGGLWDFSSTACAGAPCPAGAPVNDTCSMKEHLYSGAYIFNTTCAGTELVTPVPAESGPVAIGKDLWFSFLLPSRRQLVFSACRGSNFDTVIALYFDPADPLNCPCPGADNLDHFLVASDEGCTGANLGGGGLLYFDQCDFDPPACFTIRVGGFQGDSGLVVLDIISPTFAEVDRSPPVPPLPQPIEGDLPKVRFLSFQFPQFDECGDPLTDFFAFRVNLVSLHHVTPPYTGGPSIPFTSFEAQSRWVGPPSRYVESSSDGSDFLVSQLQCTPHYQDWSAVGRLHITGSAIVPSSTYTVETLFGSCQGLEDTPACSPGGGAVSYPVQFETARWADVETPYNPPDPTGQPDLADVAALVNKFRNAPGAPIKARALLAGADIYGNITPAILTIDFNFTHIAVCVDAFRGKPYPHTIQSCP